MLSLQNDYQLLEENYLSKGLIVGTDEAGRGPLAGPVVVAGVVFDKNIEIDGVIDSKKTSEKKRTLLANQIKSLAMAYHIEIISVDEIDRLNIYQASKYGMIKCFLEIQKQINVNILFTDAMRISPMELPNVQVLSLIKGDSRSFHIAAASILAKTARDEIMLQLHNEFSQYGWDRNKGYPTKLHRENIQKYGLTNHHRKSFKCL